MRRIAGAFSLGIALGIALGMAPAAVADDRQWSGPPERTRVEPDAVRPAARDGDGATVGWTRRLVPALRRFRLNPTPDHRERAAAAGLRP